MSKGISFDEIDRQLFNADPILENSDFVGVAVYINKEGIAHHSGIVISLKGKYYLFHYDSSDVKLRELTSGKFFYKKLVFISTEEVTAFYAHCLIVLQNANPSYGYFFTGDYYDKTGNYFSKSGLEEYMTCVGFCINVVKGFIEGNEYYIYEDWSEDDVPSWFFEHFLKELREQNPGKVIDETLFKKHLRRISPVEYTSGAYLEIPVRKKQVDEIVATVFDVLLSRQK